MMLSSVRLLSVGVLLHATIAYSADSILYKKIAQRIWRNECGCSSEKLVWWNKGEEFASLGIGHFIWYPQREKNIFTQMFPDLLRFLYKNDVVLPAWLGRYPEYIDCIWPTREDFFAAWQDARIKELRELLLSTVDLQAEFIVLQTIKKINEIIGAVGPKRGRIIRSLIGRLRQTPNGMYALIDYINFKGSGMNPRETYQGKGWGLCQVLEAINQHDKTPLLQQFVSEAKKVLTQRVQLSPKERNEQKFLAGWLKRIDTYTENI